MTIKFAKDYIGHLTEAELIHVFEHSTKGETIVDMETHRGRLTSTVYKYKGGWRYVIVTIDDEIVGASSV